MKEVKELKATLEDLDKLIPYENNAKEHPQWQIEQIMRSIQEFGFLDPIGINKEMHIIEGHGRYLACKELGIKKVPCLVLDGMTEEQERAYIIAHNKLSLNTGFDIEKLRYELNALKVQGIDLCITGFENIELENILSEETEKELLEIEDSFDDEEERGAEGLVCPHCGHKAKKKEFLECDIDG